MSGTLDSILNFLIPFLVVFGGLMLFYKLLKEPLDKLFAWIKEFFKGRGGGGSEDDIYYIPPEQLKWR